MSTLRVLQYNVQKSKNGVMIPVLEGQHAPYDVIAFQEPWLNPYVDTTYCPRSCQYNLVFSQQGRARTCLYINKHIPLGRWTSRQTPDHCWVRIEFETGSITIHSVYSETPETHDTTEWNTPIHQVLRAIQEPGQHLVLGDFNLHHPAWGGPAVSRLHAGATPVVQHIQSGLLDLLLEPGTVTREKHGNEPSTLDLALCTPGLTPWITRCKVVDGFHGSDHLPIETTIQITQTIASVALPMRNFKKANVEAVLDGAKWLRVPELLANSQDIDSYIDYLVWFIQDLISKTVPHNKPSRQAQPWWTQEVSEAIAKERRARRHWTQTRTQDTWEELIEASRAKRQQIASAKQAYWRASVHKAATSTEGIWKLAKWARTKSHLPPELPKMPDLQWNAGIATTANDKAQALSQRFYPEVPADIRDITNRDFHTSQSGELTIDQHVTSDEIRGILKGFKPDKCPGADKIPNRFLQAMGEPLIRALQVLTNAVFQTQHFPKRFRAARTIVLRKPSKPDYSEPGAWRPIALLSTIGKVIETLAARRLSDLAERENLLPDSQMGNRRNRSVETALDLLVSQIYTIWKEDNQVASVLSLDITGAFDTVNHLRLLDNLKKKRVPMWFVRTVQSFLEGRTTTLVVDGEETAPHQLNAGVPQGSPLSPILFLFYNATLLEAAYQPDLPVIPLGFADDVNLLTYNKLTTVNLANLETTYEKCLEWADSHGMKFAPNKFTLAHFTRRRGIDTNTPVRLGEVEVTPSQTVRILGLQLDTKLQWKAHGQAVAQRMNTQMLALQRTTASTWGATMPKARQIYQAIVRPSLAHGAAIWHQPTRTNKPRGLAAKLQRYQNQGLRVVLGAFKATPIRQLETEAYVPPLDLWLNGRVARYQARIARSGIAKLIDEACTAIRIRIRQRATRRRRRSALPAESQSLTQSQAQRLWAKDWAHASLDLWDQREKKLVLQEWESRWQAENRRIGRRERQAIEPGNCQVVPTNTPPTKKTLELHTGLRKAESALLVQARTGRIGLAQFLNSRRVPGYETAKCRCLGGHETPRHMTQYCVIEGPRRSELRDRAGRVQAYPTLVGTKQGAKKFVRWMMVSGRLGQFSLARRLLFSGE